MARVGATLPLLRLVKIKNDTETSYGVKIRYIYGTSGVEFSSAKVTILPGASRDIRFEISVYM
jgi:hypothetical protein